MRCVDVKRVKPLGLSTKFVPQSLLFVAPPGISETGVHLINLRGLHQKYNSLALHPLLHYYYQLNPIGEFLNNWIVGNWTLCSLLKADLRNNKFLPRFRYLPYSHQKNTNFSRPSLAKILSALGLPMQWVVYTTKCIHTGPFSFWCVCRICKNSIKKVFSSCKSALSKRRFRKLYFTF